MDAQRCDFYADDMIDAKFQVVETLGEGGFGKVFKVKDPAAQVYALKMLKLWTIPHDVRKQLIDRFDMEYQTGKIDSYYLVHSTGHGMVKGNPYIVMEYCAKGDLMQWMKRSNCDLIKLGKEILFGLKDLHRCGKVHRDLKPANVLIRDDGSAALTDFGIAGHRNKRMTERGQILGTRPYMPPEQLDPKKDATVLPTTDIFSFGVMMFQLITGNFPFGRLDNHLFVEDYHQRMIRGAWDKKQLNASDIGKSLLPVIDGCLKPDYRKRLQSVEKTLEIMPRGADDVVYRTYAQPVQMTVKKGVLLRVMQGEEFGKAYHLNALLRDGCRIITVGRYDAETKNTISIVEKQSSHISRQHCTLEMSDKAIQWHIRDGQWNVKSGFRYEWKRSLNGTFVNSTEADAEGLMIHPGDIISIGDVKLRVEGY